MLSQIKLRQLHILQNRYTPIDIEPLNPFDWKTCVKTNSTLKVHLRVESIRERQILWQPGAPVSGIIYRSPNMRVSQIINRDKNVLQGKLSSKNSPLRTRLIVFEIVFRSRIIFPVTYIY